MEEKEKLYDMYINQKMSMTEIGEFLDINSGTIFYKLKKYGIKTRNILEGNKIGGKKKRKYKIDMEKVKNLSDDGLCIQEISESLNVSYPVLYTLIKKEGIQTPTTSKRALEQRTERAEKIIDKETLNHLYHTEKKTLKEIGNMYGLNPVAILNRMKKWNIPRRTIGEATKNMYEQHPEKRLKAQEIGRANIKKRKFSLNEKTDIEKIFEEWLILNEIPATFQFQILGEGHHYDYYIDNTNIIVELDGDFWHSTEEHKKRDSEFMKHANNKGYIVIRFLRSDIMKTEMKCFDKLLEII
jgi:very-short-patch-repair endonuclease/predicted DNA-binding protein YlxM (UPF0122 family)